MLATPLQVSYQSELALARLGQMLSKMELTTEQRAELFYERAVVFDRVGLRSLVRLDFNRALLDLMVRKPLPPGAKSGESKSARHS